jgi:hypothetical protein
MVFVRVFCPGPHCVEHALHSLQFGDIWHATGEGGGGGGGGVEIGDIEGPGERPVPLRQVDHLLKEFKTNVFDIIPEGLHTMNPPLEGPVAVVPDGHDPDLIAKDPF